MRAMIASLAAATALVFSAPVAAQDDEMLDYDVAMDCGIANAYLAGIIEEDDPDFSGELVGSATVWLAMAYNRFVGEDADYEARIDSRTNELTDELTAMTGEEEVTAFFTTILGSCEIIRAANSAEYDQTEADLAAEG